MDRDLLSQGYGFESWHSARPKCNLGNVLYFVCELHTSELLVGLDIPLELLVALGGFRQDPDAFVFLILNKADMK